MLNQSSGKLPHDPKPVFNEGVTARRGRRPVKVRLVVITCMNEDGFALVAKVVPSDSAEYPLDEFGDLMQVQLDHRRTPVRVVYVDNSDKMAPGCGSLVYA